MDELTNQRPRSSDSEERPYVTPYVLAADWTARAMSTAADQSAASVDLPTPVTARPTLCIPAPRPSDGAHLGQLSPQSARLLLNHGRAEVTGPPGGDPQPVQV